MPFDDFLHDMVRMRELEDRDRRTLKKVEKAELLELKLRWGVGLHYSEERMVIDRWNESKEQVAHYEEMQKQLDCSDAGELEHKARLGEAFLQGLADLPVSHRPAMLSWIKDPADRQYVDNWLAKADHKNE